MFYGYVSVNEKKRLFFGQEAGRLIRAIVDMRTSLQPSASYRGGREERERERERERWT